MNLNWIRKFLRKQEVMDVWESRPKGRSRDVFVTTRYHGEDSLPHKTSTVEIFSMKKTIYLLGKPKIVFTF